MERHLTKLACHTYDEKQPKYENEEVSYRTIIRAGIRCKKILFKKSTEFGIPLK